MNESSEQQVANADDAFLKSLFYEQLVEHVFISEVLQEAWYGFGMTVEVLRSEVDSSGYDVVFECNGVVRHVQLKTSKADAKTSGQKVHRVLETKPSGCVVWIVRHEDRQKRRMRLSYLFFGNEAKRSLPSLEGFKTAKHTKGNAKGTKLERPAIRVIPRTKFREVNNTSELVAKLFGLKVDDYREAVESVVTGDEGGDV